MPVLLQHARRQCLYYLVLTRHAQTAGLSTTVGPRGNSLTGSEYVLTALKWSKKSLNRVFYSECGHGKCFECMFKSTGGCIICLGVGDTNAAASAVGAGRIFASVHGRVRAPAARTRHGVALKTSSAFSRESGFQSGAASVCSGPDAFPPSSAGTLTQF